jgi:hypothetical protein
MRLCGSRWGKTHGAAQQQQQQMHGTREMEGVERIRGEGVAVLLQVAFSTKARRSTPAVKGECASVRLRSRRWGSSAEETDEAYF